MIDARYKPPSYTNGFARCAGESAYPELWRGAVAMFPFCLGNTGLQAHDATRGIVATLPSAMRNSRLGPALYTNGNGKSVTYTAAPPVGLNFTVCCVMQAANLTGDTQRIWKHGTGASDGFFLTSESGGVISMGYAGIAATSLFTITTNEPWAICATGGKAGTYAWARNLATGSRLSFSSSTSRTITTGSTALSSLFQIVSDKYIWYLSEHNYAWSAGLAYKWLADPLAPFRLRSRVFAAAAAPSGAMAGTASIATAALGSLTGAGALAGTSAATSTPAATATGSGILASVLALAATLSAVLVGSGTLAGTSAVAATPTATITASGAVAGSASETATASGTLAATGALAGTSAITLIGSANPDAGGAVGSCAASVAAAGALAGAGRLDGATAIAFALTATPPVVSAGPWISAVGEAFVAGGNAGQTFVAGGDAGEAFAAGGNKGEAHGE